MRQGVPGKILPRAANWPGPSLCLGIKISTEFTNLKVHSKGRYFIFFKSLFKNYSERLVWTTKLFSCMCDITRINPVYGNSNGWRVGRSLIEHCTFQNQNLVQVIIYYCISDGNRLFSENLGCHFHFILHHVVKYIMSDKAAFVSGALLCVQRYQGNPRALQQHFPLAENEFAYICGTMV